MCKLLALFAYLEMETFAIEFRRNIFNINTNAAFEKQALTLFRFQSEHNPVYRDFIRNMKINPAEIDEISKIPFLPIELFKTKRVLINEAPLGGSIFSSSATSGLMPSKHHVPDLALYTESFRKGFELFYGDVKDYAILALLPSYLEREGSSLIFMVEDIIRQSAHPDSGFYLYNHSELQDKLEKLQEQKQKIVLIGVSFALLDFVKAGMRDGGRGTRDLIVMETGGMKGRRKEILREELHKILRDAFAVSHIHSEYGMTELLSQAYSKGEGVFHTPPWMRILIRESNDPLAPAPIGRTGGINIIDLANIYSCAFIATQDLGKVNADGSFEVLGRFDYSDIRGCNLMME